MFPGYVTMFADADSFVHLYFFPGIDNSGKQIYKNLNISKVSIPYKTIKNADSSVEYIFEAKNIVKIICNLIDYQGHSITKELTL